MVMNQLNDRVTAKEQEARISGHVDARLLENRIGVLRSQQRLLGGGEPDSGA
jgi:hypothetical protein